MQTAARGLSGSCTCPFAKEGHFCKHMVATVLRWIEESAAEGAADGDAGHREEGDDAPAEESGEEDLLRRFLGRQPLNWLVDELLESAGRDPLLRARLLVAAGAPAESAFNETLMQQALVNAFSIEGFVGYREAGDYFWGIGQVLEEVDQLVDEGFGASAARLTLFALDLVEEFGSFRGEPIHRDVLAGAGRRGHRWCRCARGGAVPGAQSGFDHLRIVQVLHREGRAEEALDWIGRGLEADDSDVHDPRLREVAASIHRDAGRIEAAGQLLWQNFEQRPGVVAYRELKSGTGADFSRWRERVVTVL